MARLIINVFLYVFGYLFCCEILNYSSFHWCQEREQAIREFLNQPARKISRYVASSTSCVPKHNDKRIQLKGNTNTKRSCYSVRFYTNLFWTLSFCHLPVHVVSETRCFGPECKDCYPSGVRELKVSKMSEEEEWPGTFWIRHAPICFISTI